MRRPWRWSRWCGVVWLVLGAALVLAGCGGGDGGSAAVLAMMQKVPGNASECTFLDLKQMRRDGDLKDIYESATARLNASQEAGIPTDNVDRMVQAGSLTVLEGRFDLLSLERQLEDGGYAESDHKGTPLWEGPSSAVALVSHSCLVTGWDLAEVEGCLDAISGDGGSICDQADVRDLLERLPAGFTVMVFAGGESFAVQYQGVRAVGYSLVKEGSDTAGMTLILVFEDAEAAGRAEGKVQEMLTYPSVPSTPSDISVTRDDRYVKATGQMSIQGQS